MDFLNFELELKLNTGTGTRTGGWGPLIYTVFHLQPALHGERYC